jgi:hypothetical protein
VRRSSQEQYFFAVLTAVEAIGFNHTYLHYFFRNYPIKNGKIKKQPSDKKNNSKARKSSIKITKQHKIVLEHFVFSIALLVAFISFFYLWTTRSKRC